MPTSYTTLLGLALPVTGELSGTWGDVVSNYITQYLDSAVAGTQTISGSQTAVTLSVTNGSSLVTAGSGATGSAQFQIINCTGNPAGLLTITAPASSRQYIIINATSTSQSVKIVGTGPTTGVTLISGEKAHVAWNGSDFVKIATTAAAGGSNTQVQYNSSGVLAGSSNMTFDGTSLSLNASPNLYLQSGGVERGRIVTGSGSVDLLAGSTTTPTISMASSVATFTNNPILSGGTANGVLYLNGSKAATSGSALTFDGTTLVSGSSGTTTKLTLQGGAQTSMAIKSSTGTSGFLIGRGYASDDANSFFLYDLATSQNRFYIDTTPNIFQYATAHVWNNAANSTEYMRLTSTGLGIGTTSPGAKVHAYDTSNSKLLSETTTGYAQFQASSTSGDFHIVIDNSTGAGFGAGAYSRLLYSTGAYPMVFSTNATERARITSGGDLLVSKTAGNDTSVGLRYVASQYLSIVRDGNPPLYLNRLSSDGRIAEFARSSTIVGSIDVTTTATSYVTSSDYRIKHDIQPMTGALAKVAALKPVTYKWNVDDSAGEGFIAHELAEVCPQAVTGEKDAVDADGKPVYQGIDTSFLVATLTAAIQEQQTIIQSLTARIAALESKGA